MCLAGGNRRARKLGPLNRKAENFPGQAFLEGPLIAALPTGTADVQRQLLLQRPDIFRLFYIP